MARLSSNCRVTLEEPSELDEVISVTPAMRPSDRSSGVATVAAIVSGLAPGSEACTEMVGKSTCGSGETGSSLNAIAPASATPSVSSVVATGRSMNGADRFMTGLPTSFACCPGISGNLGARTACRVDTACEPVEREVDHRCCEKRERLREDQPAD